MLRSMQQDWIYHCTLAGIDGRSLGYVDEFFKALIAPQRILS